MKSRASELAVGIFVILFGIALFFIAMRVSGLVGSNLSDRYEMSATFDNVNGLRHNARRAPDLISARPHASASARNQSGTGPRSAPRSWSGRHRPEGARGG